MAYQTLMRRSWCRTHSGKVCEKNPHCRLCILNRLNHCSVGLDENLLPHNSDTQLIGLYDDTSDKLLLR
jgi:hypothetical protein